SAKTKDVAEARSPAAENTDFAMVQDEGRVRHRDPTGHFRNIAWIVGDSRGRDADRGRARGRFEIVPRTYGSHLHERGLCLPGAILKEIAENLKLASAHTFVDRGTHDPRDPYDPRRAMHGNDDGARSARGRGGGFLAR